MKVPPLNLQMIHEDGVPVRAIIDVAALEALLEIAEDASDVAYLRSLSKHDMEFVPFAHAPRAARRVGRNKPNDAGLETHDGRGKVRSRHRKAG